MKLSKKLIITGLLFSSVLGSVNVSAITAMAAGADEAVVPPVSEEKDVTFNFVDDKNVSVEGTSQTKKVTVKDNIVEKSDVPAFSKENYRVKADQTYKVVKGADGTFTVSVQVEKTRSVAIKYFNGKTAVTDADEKGKTVEVLDSAKIVENEKISSPDGYRVKSGQTFTISKDGTIAVQVEKTKKVAIKYFVGGEEKTPENTNNSVEVLDSAKTVTADEVKFQADHYRIKGSSKSFTIENNVIKVDIEETQNIPLEFEDNKGSKITNDKLPKDVEVAKDSKEVSLKDIKLPTGYKLDMTKNPVIQDGKAKVVIASVENVYLHVTYVDKEANKKVATVKLKGNAGSAHKLDIPAGYKVVDGSSNVVKFSKGVTEVTILVEKVTPIQAHQSTISTFPGGYVSLYDSKGKVVTNRALSANSSWASDKIMTLNGAKYYRVATNEWVKASDVYEYVGKQMTVTTKAGAYKMLYTLKGKELGHRALSANSSWASDKSTTINGEKMYRVATNEWVKASDIK